MRLLAKLYMIDWTGKLKEKLKLVQENSDKALKLDLNLEAYSIYVDDESSVQKPTPQGATYNQQENKIEIKHEQMLKDENIEKDRRTANLIVDIANSIDPSIQVVASVPSDFPNKKLPLLNSQVWIENNPEYGPQIRFEHYEKTMASALEIQKDSAISEQTKRATLVQGGLTRLLNTSIELGKDKQNEILSQYMKKLQTSGYDKKFRVEILKSIIKAWKSILEKDRTGERPLHRPRNFMKAERKNEKNDKKLNWFKGRNGNTFSSVLMVPITPNGELK